MSRRTVLLAGSVLAVVAAVVLVFLATSSSPWKSHGDQYRNNEYFDRVEDVDRLATSFNQQYDEMPSNGGQSTCDLFAQFLASNAESALSAAEQLDAGRTEAALDLTWQEHYDELLGRFFGMLEWFRQHDCSQAGVFAGFP